MTTAASTAISIEEIGHIAHDLDRASMIAMLEGYRERIYRLAIRLVGNPSDAEEVTQDTFVRAIVGIASFRGDAAFGTWLYRVAVNEALMRKRAARRRATEALEELTPAALGTRIACEPSPGADALLDDKRILARVRDALAELEDPLRAALVLRDLEELSAEEAGAILGISADAVRQRAHRARLRLREALGPLIERPPDAAPL